MSSHTAYRDASWTTDVFFYKLAAELAVQMKDVAEELIAQLPLVEARAAHRGRAVRPHPGQGLLLLEDALANLGDAKVIPGEVVFKLYTLMASRPI